MASTVGDLTLWWIREICSTPSNETVGCKNFWGARMVQLLSITMPTEMIVLGFCALERVKKIGFGHHTFSQVCRCAPSFNRVCVLLDGATTEC